MLCSSKDTASSNMANHLIESHNFSSHGPGRFECIGEGISLQIVDKYLWEYQEADLTGADIIYFLSQHHSSEGIPALTVHSTGNWNEENKFGGKASTLSAAAPVAMLSALRNLGKTGYGIGSTYEATHHGPCLETPSLFAEMGGNEETISDRKLAELAAERIFESAIEIRERRAEFRAIAIGIGGGHYPYKFSAMANAKGYAFSYIMPKYAIRNKAGSVNLEMLSQAVLKTKSLDIAVIDWKGLDSTSRKDVIAELGRQGIDYVKA
ncbi:MAG: D-aminoacyl-tRNA deacylase [Candidatus Micrarchaeaceae archaeon]